jgi:hypothetical protein
MVLRWLLPLLNRRSPSSSGPALRRSVRLTLERLEDRWVPSAFSYDSGTQTLTITGSTTSANQFQFDQVTYGLLSPRGKYTQYTFTMNGETQQYGGPLQGAVMHVIVKRQRRRRHGDVDHQLGLPAARPVADIHHHKRHDPGAERRQASARPQQQRQHEPMPQPTDFMFLNNFRNTYTYLTHVTNTLPPAQAANTDSAQLTDSTTGSDRFVTAGTYAYMTDDPNNPTYLQFVSGASNVYGYSANPGHDSTTHYDSAGSVDAFVSSGSAYSYLSGSDANNHAFFNEAVGFTMNYAVATHGNAVAYLIDSPRNDVFAGQTSYSYLYNDNMDGSLALFNEAQGFQKVYAQSFNGGTDFAYNYDANRNVLSGAWILLT